MFHNICSQWLCRLAFGLEHCLQIKQKHHHASYKTSIKNSYLSLFLVRMKNITPIPISWAENKVWIMWMNVFWFSLLHISNLMIACRTVHNTDVIWLSQYEGRVVCMIISNPLCSGFGSGLASDPSWPPWNWFYMWIPNKSEGEGDKHRRKPGETTKTTKQNFS